MNARILILTGALIILCAASVSGEADKKARFKVRSVTIEGNQAFEDRRILGLMLTRPSAFLNRSSYYPEIFADDLDNILLFYQQNGYLEAALTDTTVTIDSLAGAVDVYLSITEGDLTRTEGVSFSGNTVFPDSELVSLVRLARGDPFRRGNVQNGMVAILSRYAERGYLDAAVKPDVKIDSEQHLATVDLIITEHRQARVGTISLEGIRRSRPGVIMRELMFREGDIIRYSRLVESQRRLYLTGLFESVFIRPQPTPGTDSTTKDIVIDVKEKLSSEFNVAVGFGSIEKVRGRIEVLTRNLAGTARQLGGSLRASFIRRAVEGSFTEPRTLGSRWRTDLNLLFEFLEEPGYDLSRYGARLTVGRTVTRQTTASVTLRYEDATLRHVEAILQPDDFDSRIRSLIFSIVHDTRDNLFNPTRGGYAEWTNEVAGSFMQSNNTFVRSGIRVKYFRPWAAETIVGSALEIGWMGFYGRGDYIPLNERFYTGGPNSLRGFRYQLVGPIGDSDVPLGGQFKIVWNAAEIRRPIYRMVGGGVFIDVGNVWTGIGKMRLRDIRADVGTGLRANTPIGIIRLDYGLNVDRRLGEPRGRLYLSTGHAF